VELLAFASFAALVVAWIVAPNTSQAPLAETTVEAHAEAA
jgi:hypothetical protein